MVTLFDHFSFDTLIVADHTRRIPFFFIAYDTSYYGTMKGSLLSVIEHQGYTYIFQKNC